MFGMQRQDNGRKGNSVLALSALAAVAAIDVACANGLKAQKGNRKTANADYGDRSGFPRGLEAAWGGGARFPPARRQEDAEIAAPSQRRRFGNVTGVRLRCPSNLDLGTELDDLARRHIEEGSRPLGVALQESENRFPP
jgi:hypothetical protein